ncbi:YqaA family protein [Aestuariibacter salexigens]|uniref:YqaA family protein n=1 Tax=Aestuariibacter salexigens TaxID=226010 RepID=UPI000405B251|nr:VTT domain-containing protein [Aestuariibacter salexigens]
MLKGIFVASFLESTIVPVPIEAVLLPLMQAKRDKLWSIAWMATLGCMLGAMVGYAAGYFMFELLADFVAQAFASPQQLEDAIDNVNEQGFWFILMLGIVPLPLQIGMLAAGATGFPIVLYLLAIFISRAIRYFGIAIVIKFAGNSAERVLRRNKSKALLLSIVIIATAWWFTSQI